MFSVGCYLIREFFSFQFFSICQHWRFCLLKIIYGLVPSTEIALSSHLSFVTSPSVWICDERCIR